MALKLSAPGKIILSGEHSVVYGYPALASAIDKRLTIDESGEINSDIPVGVGMGSSAAFSVAQAAVKIGMRDLKKVNALAYEMEKKYHGTPSGIDNTVATYGGFIWYRKESESLKLIERLKMRNKFTDLFIVNTGKPAENTREMVGFVSSQYKSGRLRVESIFKKIEVVTREFLNQKKINIRDLITENECLLERLGVVSGKTKNLVRRIEKIGGAAKVCGAGGKKTNSGIILVYHSDKEKLFRFAEGLGLDIFPVKLGVEGVRNERTDSN